MHVAAVNGTHIHYRDIDPGGGRPVLVFSNSLGADFRIWDRVIDRPGDRFRIITYDKRGHGLSDGAPARWFSADFRSSKTAELSAWRNLLVRTTADGYAGTCAALRDADLTESSAKLDVPTLCICGSEDGATTPDLVRSTADLIPGARFELVEGAGHLPCIEAPDAVADLILEFTAETVDA